MKSARATVLAGAGRNGTGEIPRTGTRAAAPVDLSVQCRSTGHILLEPGIEERMAVCGTAIRGSVATVNNIEGAAFRTGEVGGAAAKPV